MMAGFKVFQTGKKISIKWGKVGGVDGYRVYVQYCGKQYASKSTKTVLVDKAKKQLSDAHAKELRYKSTDTSVASVSKKGKITAKGKGSCIIYVYARNGYAREIRIVVK